MIPDSIIVEMREKSAAGVSRVELAKHYGIDEGSVSRIVRGESRRKAGGPLTPKVEKKKDEDWYDVDPKTGCWLWKGRTTPGGYGVHATGYDAGYSQLAHRYFYETRVGPVPAGKELDHLCRVTTCVNPAHLEAVTPGENVQRSNRTLLDWPTVKRIRALYLKGDTSQHQLAAMFNVHRSTICMIVTNRNWHDPEYKDPAFGQGTRKKT